MSPRYEWQRFWCPREGSFRLDNGYLVDPTTTWGRPLNPDLRSLQDLRGARCLVLLGEPGIGKSIAMGEEHARGSGGEGCSAEVWTAIDLRSYGSEDRLFRDLTGDVPQIADWVPGDGNLTLFLDSLDECLLRIDTLATLLPEALVRLPVGRLRVRVACRTGDWPQALEEGLVQLFGREDVGVYELMPLRRVDVATATTASGLDSELFLRDVAEREVEALANRPVTLQFLLMAKQQRGTLPKSRVELYRDGCRLLVGETNQARFEGPYRGRLNTDQRVTLAERMAAATVFANRAAIWTGPETGPLRAEDVTFRELRTAPTGLPTPSDDELDEVLSTGLFSSRGPQRLGWAHQTYAEFLAAQWTVTARLQTDQILGLLTNPHDPARQLAPQLNETAGWVASMRRDVFEALVPLHPETLLRGDAATADAEQRRVLTRALLEAYGAERILDTDWSLRPLYRKLFHPGLGAQLRPFIGDRTKGTVVRRAAVNIAEACHVTELQRELIQVALDPGEEHGLRTEAAAAASAVADSQHRAELRSLLTADRDQDPDDELRGHALEALWPDYMGTEELFGHLSPPRTPNLYGQYKHFIRNVVAKNLPDRDLSAALDWVLHREPERALHGDVLEDFADKIVIRVCRSGPGSLLDRLAGIFVHRVQQEVPIVGSEHQEELTALLSTDTQLRRGLVVAMLERMTDKRMVWALWHGGASLIDRSDLQWLLDWIVHGVGSGGAKRVGAEALVRFLFDPRSADDVNAVLDGARESAELAAALAPFVDPVELDSAKAAAMRSEYEKREATERRWKELETQRSAPLVPSPTERVHAALERCEAGSLDGFWVLTRELTLTETSRHYDREYAPDLTSFPGWRAADAETRARIITAAKSYLRLRVPDTARWLGTNIWHRPAFAGYRALRLIAAIEPAYVARLTSADWARWAPVMVAYRTSGDSVDDAVRGDLLARAYEAAPDAVLEALSRCIDKDSREHGHVFGLEIYDQCCDERMARTFLGKAINPSTGPEAFRELLWRTLVHGLPEALDYTRSLLEGQVADGGERAVIAATLLMQAAPEKSHEFVLSLLERNEDVGRAVVSVLADSRYGPTLQRLPEPALARLYIGISRYYPHSEDPDITGVHVVGRREQVAWFRNGVLNVLKERGSLEAVSAIESIMADLPHQGWLKHALYEVRVRARSKIWSPPAPAEVLALGGTAEGRLVRSGAELLQAVIASLKRLEEWLQGETPAAPDLWNQAPDHCRPKDEPALSDYVKRHLDADLKRRGVVVGREVEIRRGEGTGIGEHTDIHVDAVARDNGGRITDVVTVIVEAKGCWHPELRTAMETQLVARYLKDSQCRHGLYLVGWFDCPQWDARDRRRGPCTRSTRADLESYLVAQAERLSNSDIEVRSLVLNAALR